MFQDQPAAVHLFLLPDQPAPDSQIPRPPCSFQLRSTAGISLARRVTMHSVSDLTTFARKTLGDVPPRLVVRAVAVAYCSRAQALALTLHQWLRVHLRRL